MLNMCFDYQYKFKITYSLLTIKLTLTYQKHAQSRVIELLNRMSNLLYFILL